MMNDKEKRNMVLNEVNSIESINEIMNSKEGEPRVKRGPSFV